MNCPNCGSERFAWWHFYWNYGSSGAFRCLNCKAIYKAVADRQTGRHKIGKFVKIGERKRDP